MRFITLSILLQVLALGYTSAQDEKGFYNLQCGVNSK
jgi:hypothetical protein